MERLSGLDASFLYLEAPSLHMHVAIATVFDPSTVPGGYSFVAMRDRIAERTRSGAVFRRRLVEVPFRLGHPVWVDDPEFDIGYHVRRAALPSPGGYAELADLTAEITGHQLDRSKPLWEIWIVEGLADGRIAVVAKMHHSTVDGVSGAALLSRLFDLSADPADEEGPAVPDRPLDHRMPSGIELMATAVAARTLRPLELSRDVLRTGQRLLDVVRLRNRPALPAVAKAALPLSAPRTSFNTAVTRRRKVAFTAIGLDDVKRLKNATGTTVNDVVLAVCTGALRTFLAEGDEIPDRPLVAVVPVSVRPDDDNAKGSNQVSAMFVQLPANMDEPLARLMAIREGTKGAKEEHNALGAHLLQDWSEYATPNVFANAARFYTRMRLADRHRPIANLVVSNVPGPDFPLYLAGAELEAMFPLGPVMDGMGLNITIMSYRGVLSWGIITCREAMPGVWRLAAAIPDALDDLLAAAGEAPARYRSAAARAAVEATVGPVAPDDGEAAVRP